MITFRHSMALLALLALGLGFALAPIAPQAVAQDQPENSTDEEVNLVKYVIEVLDKIQKHHPEGKKHTKAEYIAGARDSVCRAILAKPDMDEKLKEGLVKFLRKKEFESMTQLMHVLDKFSRRFSSLNMEAVSDAACTGIIKVTGDQFSRIMTTDEMQSMQQQMQQGGADKSIGVAPMPIKVEGQDPNDLTIRLRVGHVRRNYIGWDMGLRENDEILAINHTLINDIPRAELNAKFQLEIGAQIEFTIKREGHDGTITVSGIQRNHDHPSARGTLLPCGKIGYIDTNMFSMTLHTEVKAEIDRLLAMGMKALILDLRNNPGGAMPACTELADYFLEPGELITTTKGTYENPLQGLAQMFQGGSGAGEKIDAETTVWKAKQANPYEFPLIVLINKMSASASEMLSGCFKSHKRGIVIGETSFGKGIGQTAVMLSRGPKGSLGIMGMFGGGQGMRMLYMTVMTYFLPHGEEVHHIGIIPDIKVVAEDYDADTFAKVAKLRASGQLKGYLDHIFDAESGFCTGQVTGAPAELSAWPFQEKLKEAITARQGLSDDVIARELRHAVKVRFGAAQAQFNLADDNQLQAAIKAACKSCGIDHSSIENYRFID